MKQEMLEKLNRYTVEIVKFHFSDNTGSKFWLSKLKELPFDPLKEINGFSDLKKFPDFSDELRNIPIYDLVPKGLRQEQNMLPDVFESGGATGKPKRIIEYNSRLRGIEWINEVLNLHGFPSNEIRGEWLFVGPSGPHIVGRSMGRLAKLRGSMCFYIDFDPRWVRKCIKGGETSTANKYIDHIIQQVKDILIEQNIKVIFITPTILEKLISDKELLKVAKEKIKGIIWSGTSFSSESIRLIKEDIFNGIVVIGLYGNTIMGIAGQRPASVDDKYPANFYPYFPNSIIEVVDFQDSTRLVDYYQTGQVKVTLLTKEMFLPNNLERDQAVRIPPSGELFAWDGVAEVKPIVTPDQKIIEGVY